MVKGLIGKKIGMTQIFDESGLAIPVTVIEAGPCYVTQVRLPEKDGYSAVQMGFGETKPKRLTGGQLGHLKRNNLPPLNFLREFRVKDPDVQEGDPVTVAVFAVGERVDVVGTSKGKGFQGGVKRYHFKGGPRTHGASDRERAPGSQAGCYRAAERRYRTGRRSGAVPGLRRLGAQVVTMVTPLYAGASAVLIDPTHALTAGHVVNYWPTGTFYLDLPGVRDERPRHDDTDGHLDDRRRRVTNRHHLPSPRIAISCV